eukprot:74854-Amphidinium_carterae.1
MRCNVLENVFFVGVFGHLKFLTVCGGGGTIFGSEDGTWRDQPRTTRLRKGGQLAGSGRCANVPRHPCLLSATR